MRVNRGLSWGLADGTWRKENVAADTSDFDLAHLTTTQAVAWVSIELEIQLLTLKWFYGGLDKENLDLAVESLLTTQQGIETVITR